MRTAQPTSLCHNLPCSKLTKQPTTIFFYVLCSACNLLPYSSMHTAQLTTFCNIPSSTHQPTTFCHIFPCTHISQQPSTIFFHKHSSANNLLPFFFHANRPAFVTSCLKLSEQFLLHTVYSSFRTRKATNYLSKYSCMPTALFSQSPCCNISSSQ
jgi:hypothetical protein